MGRAILITPLARQDVINLSDYIAGDNLDAALRFIDAVEHSFGRLSVMPEQGSLCHFQNSLTVGIRVWPVHEFRNYLIFYRADEDPLEIIRVLHGSRDMESLFDE